MDEDQQQEGQQEEEQKEQRIAPAAFTSFNISAPPRRPISSLALFQRQSADGDEELAAAVKSNQTAITSINSTLAAVTVQISALNQSLVQVAEQIKQSAAIENLKMAQERKQEMMLADRNLKRGAENNLERGIQAALFAPVQRIGAKATFTLTRLINFFNVLLGGFIVGRTLNLITALVNDDKEALKNIGDTIVGQLAAAGGIFLAINGGLLIALNSLTRLATFLTQVAVSNLLIKPIRLIFNIAKGLVTAIAAAASGIFNNVSPPTTIGPQNNKPNTNGDWVPSKKMLSKTSKTDIDKNIQNDGHIYYPSRSGNSELYVKDAFIWQPSNCKLRYISSNELRSQLKRLKIKHILASINM